MHLGRHPILNHRLQPLLHKAVKALYDKYIIWRTFSNSHAGRVWTNASKVAGFGLWAGEKHCHCPGSFDQTSTEKKQPEYAPMGWSNFFPYNATERGRAHSEHMIVDVLSPSIIIPSFQRCGALYNLNGIVFARMLRLSMGSVIQ